MRVGIPEQLRRIQHRLLLIEPCLFEAVLHLLPGSLQGRVEFAVTHDQRILRQELP